MERSAPVSKSIETSRLIPAFSLLLIPFVLVAIAYPAMPQQIPVMRTALTHSVLVAPKSPFMVFRVPLMNLIHGTMAALMLTYAPAFSNSERRAGYAGIFLTLMYMVGLKSLFEALEFTAMGHASRTTQPGYWLTVGTVLCVVFGLALAAWRSRKVPLPWPELRMAIKDKVALAALLGLYLAIVAASFTLSNKRLP